MQARFQRITPFLWFDGQAEEAATFYTSIFDNARVTDTTRYGKEAAQATGRPEGSAMTVVFELDGQTFTAINGGPQFRFNEAVSLVVNCRDQDEINHYWDRLSEGGDEKAQVCGWLKDRYGLSWQVVPAGMERILRDPDPDRAQRAMAAMMKMTKLDMAELQRAADAAPAGQR